MITLKEVTMMLKMKQVTKLEDSKNMEISVKSEQESQGAKNKIEKPRNSRMSTCPMKGGENHVRGGNSYINGTLEETGKTSPVNTRIRDTREQEVHYMKEISSCKLEWSRQFHLRTVLKERSLFL